jgi:hypothetical protein
MADKKITELDAAGAVADTDLVELVQAVPTTPANKKLTWASVKSTLKTYFDSLYADALGADDKYVTAAEKVKLSNLSVTNTGDQTLPTRDSLGLNTDDSPQFTALNIGHASDTTLSRSAAGVLAVEGVVIPTISSTSTLTNKTLGTTQIDENAVVKLDAALSADGKYSGYGFTGTAGTALAFGQVAYYAAADSKWELTDADAEATAGPVRIAIVAVAGAENATVTLLTSGNIREDDWNWGTIGAPVYLDTATAGGMTLTAPSGTDDVIRIVGYVVDANTIWFCPDNFYFTHT